MRMLTGPNPRIRHSDRTRRTIRRTLMSFVAVIATVLASLTLSVVPASAAIRTVSGTVSFGTVGNHPADVSAVVTWQKYVTNVYVAGPAEGVRTDAAGRYSLSLEPGVYKLRFAPSSADYQAVWWGGVASQYTTTVVEVGDAALSGMDITLPPRGSLSGLVFLGDAGTPAGAGEVEATATACLDGACSTLPPVSTDAAGRYTFTGLAHADYTVQFEYLGGQRYQSPLTPVSATISTMSLDVTAADVVLPASASISGTVVLGPDRVSPGTDVVVTARKHSEATGEWTDTSVRTAPDGSYSFAALERGTYELRFDYQGAGGFADQWWPANPVPAARTRFVLGLEPLTRDAVLPVGASVAGTIRTEAGAPVAGATVTAIAYDTADWSSAELGEALTATDGTYELAGLPAAGYVLEVTADGFAHSWISYFELAGGEQRTGVDGALARHRSISGSITCDRCDEPEVADRLYVEFERNVGTRSEPAWVPVGAVMAVATEEADGAAAYTISTEDGLVPGVFRASVSGGWGWRTRANVSQAVTVEDGANVELDLTAELLKFDRDFSGDENPDVLVRTSTGLMRMYAGNGASGWKGGPSTIGSGWSVMNHVFAAGDFSGDGHEDVMARDAAGRLHLYRGDGTGGWLGWGVVGTGWGHMTAIFSPGDFSGDGNADVLARDGAGNLWLYPGDGNGGWGAVSKVGSGWNMFDQVFAAGDFGGYGEANVMGRTPNGDLWVYQATGYGSWVGQYRAGIGWNMFDAVFGAGDFDGDGWDDVMGRDRMGRLLLYPGNGGLFKQPSVVGTGWGDLSFVS